MSHSYDTWIQPDTFSRGFPSHYSSQYSSFDTIHHPAQISHYTIPVSSYSSLSGALDSNAVVTRARSHSVHRYNQDISSKYAYPTSHHDSHLSPKRSQTHSHDRHREREPQPTAPHTSKHMQTAARSIIGPTNHVRLPQRKFYDDVIKPYAYVDPTHRNSTITFQLADFPEVGVRIGKILAQHPPTIVGGDDQVLGLGDREVKIRILWPGYSSEPYQKRMKTLGGTVPRDTLLIVLGNAIFDFVAHIKKHQIPVEKGYEDWAIGPQPNGKQGLVGPEIFITALVHCGGSNWQPDLWIPKKRPRSHSVRS